MAGDIEGVVKFPGETPPPTMIANGLDASCPRGIAQTHLIVRQQNRGLKSALVILDFKENVTQIKATPIGLKSEGCVLSPRVQWAPLPAYLTMTNLDDTDEELLGLEDGNQVFRVELSGKGTSVRRPLTRSGGLHRLVSTHHPWMQSWVYTSPHPYVAVTDASGAFAIRNVPAGTYTLRAWHEGWVPRGKDKEGRQQFQPVEEIRSVKVRSDETTTLYFENLEPTF